MELTFAGISPVAVKARALRSVDGFETIAMISAGRGFAAISAVCGQ